MGGVYDTFVVGGAVPLGGGHALFADASIVLSGTEIGEWVGGPPVVVTVGTSWNL